MKTLAPQIYLIPTIIAPDTQDTIITEEVKDAISRIDHYLVENIRSARRFISSLKIREVSELNFELFDKNTPEDQLEDFMTPIIQGLSMGVISEAGCPSVADPGSVIVRWAHNHQIPVVPLAGPSSILLALMASGMNGQRFEFHGYLPIDKTKRSQKIKALEKESLKTGKSQIFMETPYRNNALLDALMKECNPATGLCLASDITAPQQTIVSKSINQWKDQIPDLHKKPTIFILQAVF